MGRGWKISRTMKLIPLTQGKFAKVDDEDFEFLSQWKWRAHRDFGTFYARTTGIRMHRLLTKAPKGSVVDHRDGDGLNNQKSNLWIPAGSGAHENALNRRGLSKNNKSGISGVSWNKREEKWKAQVVFKGKYITVGYYKHKEDAAMAVVNFEPRSLKSRRKDGLSAQQQLG